MKRKNGRSKERIKYKILYLNKIFYLEENIASYMKSDDFT